MPLPASGSEGRPQRTALITGAAGGLGLEMARALISAGVDVALTDRNQRLLTALQDDPELVAGTFLLIEGDIGSETGRAGILKTTRDELGPIDILVNNAGVGLGRVRNDFIAKPVRFWEISPEIATEAFIVNAIAPYLLAAAVAEQMMDRGWGRIVNVTTSLTTMARLPLYGGSKASLEVHTAHMARDLAGSGVTANVLVPGGLTATPMTAEVKNLPCEMLGPEIMRAPLIWMISPNADAVTGWRFEASKWQLGAATKIAALAAGQEISAPWASELQA